MGDHPAGDARAGGAVPPVLRRAVGLLPVGASDRPGAAEATEAVGTTVYGSWLASLIFTLVSAGTTALISRAWGAGDSPARCPDRDGLARPGDDGGNRLRDRGLDRRAVFGRVPQALADGNGARGRIPAVGRDRRGPVQRHDRRRARLRGTRKHADAAPDLLGRERRQRPHGVELCRRVRSDPGPGGERDHLRDVHRQVDRRDPDGRSVSLWVSEACGSRRSRGARHCPWSAGCCGSGCRRRWTGSRCGVHRSSFCGSSTRRETRLSRPISSGSEMESLSYLPAMAWGIATATLVGHRLGAGFPDRAIRSPAALQQVIFVGALGGAHVLLRGGADLRADAPGRGGAAGRGGRASASGGF